MPHLQLAQVLPVLMSIMSGTAKPVGSVSIAAT